MRVVHLFASLTAIVLALEPTFDRSGVAAGATPTPSASLDLAALTLRPADLDEPGWVHDGAFVQPLAAQARDHAAYLGSETTADLVASVLTDAGWERQYVCLLSRASERDPARPAARVRSYITRYASPEGASAGFAYLEDERSVAAASDIPIAGSHGDASEFTRERVVGDDGTAVRSLDLTFRVGNLVAGVTVITDDSADRASSDQALVERLASRLEERIAGAGNDDVGIGANVSRLGSERHDIVTFDDAYYRTDAEDVPLGGESSQAAHLRTAAYAGADDVYQLWQGINTGDGAAALYGLTLLRFEDEAAAELWVEELESTLTENPFYGDLRFVSGAGGQGLGDAAVALSYVANGGGGDAPRSMLVAVRDGADVARVHMVPQGALPSIPLEPVVELARWQLTCLREAACRDTVDVPATLSDILVEVSRSSTSPASSPAGA